MIAPILCALAFVAAYWGGRHSRARGLLLVMAVGYVYGILRANIPSPFSHFIFDAALVGLYASQSWIPGNAREATRTGALRGWCLILIIWPILVCFMPFQTLLVSIVGLRGNVFFLPVLLIGSQLRNDELREFSYGLACLNLFALAFGIMEYVVGVEPFFPRSAVTSVIYSSKDVAGFTAYRIPSTFTSAHAFAGTLISTIPFLFGGWIQRSQTRFRKNLLVSGIAAALFGILLASTRTNFILAIIMIAVATLSNQVSVKNRLVWAAIVVAVVTTALTNERFQRFKSLGDADIVVERIRGSVNRGFWEILAEYPMGNGLGGGGTSIPAFLEDKVNRPVSMESEYARILLEQGIIGLLLYVGFIIWFLTRLHAFADNLWLSGRRLAWFNCVISLGGGLLGIGIMTSIPGSLLLFLSMGWIAVRPAAEAAKPVRLDVKGRISARQRRPQFA
jgi:hypothetical protein